MSVFEQLLASRGLTGKKRDAFLNPSYDIRHDPYLLPDMDKAVDRLSQALRDGDKITIYGDYDIDGLTATTLLLDAFESFGYKGVDAFIPNRFVEGYGLTEDAVERIAATGAKIIITVDCGSLSEREIIRANELGVDVIVTDHHNVAPIQPPAVAVINPKRLLQDYPEEYEKYLLKPESKMNGKIYPFLDLAGVGVAFKLVQAMQEKIKGLPDGQEKWLLDLVALGTVCDVVSLIDENRTNVFWGLKVLSKIRRSGIKALLAVTRIDPKTINSRTLGFVLGPRLNASGRLETAQYSLDLLRANDNMKALELAEQLDVLNTTRKAAQQNIIKQANTQIDKYNSYNVLVLSGSGWNHGIIGIVAAKMLERYKKPTYILEEMGDQSKGSARSFGDFSVADAIQNAGNIVTKGGGHKLAAGLTLPTKNIEAFRQSVNTYYESLKLKNQQDHLLPRADVEVLFSEISEELIQELSLLEPFGNANSEPVLITVNVTVIKVRKMGADNQHVKLATRDTKGTTLELLAFNAPDNYFVQEGQKLTVWYQPTVNEWQGRRTVEGRLLHLETITD